MAGSYPDVPGRRMAYDRDGSFVGLADFNLGTVTEWAVGDKQNVNNEDSSDEVIMPLINGTENRALVIVFPEARNVVGYCYAYGIGDGVVNQSAETSTDTTNGIDGTWTAQAGWSAGAFTKAFLRNNIAAVTWNGIRGIRIRHTVTPNPGNTVVRSVAAFHLYGDIAAGQSVDRLRFWDPTLDQEVGGAFFDWGDTPRNTTATKTFRVKNNSATLTANAVSLLFEALTNSTPSLLSQFAFSTDGVNFAAAPIALGNLLPGALTGVITVRRTLDPNAALSLWTARMVADATSWS